LILRKLKETLKAVELSNDYLKGNLLRHTRAEGYYRRDASLGKVEGAWKTFVQGNKDRDSRTMELAQVQRSEMDNFNTPDLDQGSDSILRPGETLDDFDVTFRKPNAEGGRIGFNEAGPVNKPGAWKTAKKNLLNRYVEGLPEGYLEDYIELFLNDRGDGTFSKKASVEEGVAKMKEKYDDILKTQYSSRQTNKSKKKFLEARVIDINSSILQDLKSKGSIVSGLPDAKIVREKDLKIVGDFKDKNTPKGKALHHFLPLAGMEGKSINLA
jgi:hypothetical protein